MTGKTLEDGTPSGLPAAATLGIWISVVESSKLGFRGDLPTVTELGGRQWDQSLLPDPDRVLFPPSQDLRAKSDSALNPLHGSGSGRGSGCWSNDYTVFRSASARSAAAHCLRALSRPLQWVPPRPLDTPHRGTWPSSPPTAACLPRPWPRLHSPGPRVAVTWSSRCPSPWQYLPV